MSKKKPPRGRYVELTEEVWLEYDCPDCGTELFCPCCDQHRQFDTPWRQTQIQALKELGLWEKAGKPQ